MDYLNPIFTEKTTCQDCYKCLRECSVKAIQIEKSCARILPEECTLCGHCVAVCPVGAKKVRDDTGRFKALRQGKNPLVALLAPSWVSEYPGLSLPEMTRMLKEIGFEQVLEVSCGAQAASIACVDIMNNSPEQRKLFISSACPTMVRYLQLYQPHLAPMLLNVESPLELAARIAHRQFGPEYSCVFFGPCIAKKSESDRNRDLLALALTYRDLDSLLSEHHGSPFSTKAISASATASATAKAVNTAAGPGGGTIHKAHLYPIDGGMTAGIKQIMGRNKVDTMVFSGMQHVRQALEAIDPDLLESPLFLELMACEGGCVNGPQARSDRGTIVKRLDILREQSRDLPWDPGFSIPAAVPPVGATSTAPVHYVCTALSSHGQASSHKSFTEEDLRQSLARIGKHVSTDELNCAACGYDSCRDFARACLIGKAESTMCVSWMRNLVQKKANALLAAMPSGVVILDRDLKIVESNRNFARMMGGDTEDLFDVHPGLVGADGRLVLPRPDLFRQVLESPGTSMEEDLLCNGRILHCHIFGIEPGQVAGGLFEDITIPTVQRDRVVQQAQEVIEKHLGVVQQIAWLLGENAAESEAILNSIIQSFSPASTPASTPAALAPRSSRGYP